MGCRLIQANLYYLCVSVDLCDFSKFHYSVILIKFAIWYYSEFTWSICILCDVAEVFIDDETVESVEWFLWLWAVGLYARCRVVLRKQVHKKTVIRDGQEETLVTEDTHIEQDSEGPEELRESVQEVIDRFMKVDGDNGSGEPL